MMIKNFLLKLKKKIIIFRSIKLEKLNNFKKKIIFESKIHKIPSQYLDTILKSRSSNFYKEPEGYVSELSNIFLYTDSGLLRYNNKIIIESAFDKIRLVKTKNVFKTSLGLKYKINRNLKKNICTSFIHQPWSNTSNYHWIIDCLSRIYLMKDYFEEEVTVILNKDIKDFQLQTLKFCLPIKWKLYKVDDEEIYEIDSFIFPSFVIQHNSGFLNIKILDFIKTKILKGYNTQINSKHNRKIYISRSNAKLRKIINEDQLIELLKKYNFEVIHSENLNYKDQVELFYNSRIIISPHGAGLTNILFSKDAKVIEIHPRYRVKSHYCYLSMSLNFDYYPIYVDANKHDNDNMSLNNTDFFNLEKLIKKLNI